MTQLEVGLSIAVAILLAVIGIGAYMHHEGYQGCVQTQEVTDSKAEVKDAHLEANQAIADAAQDQTRENELTAPIAPTPTVPAPAFSLHAPAACPVPRAAAAPRASQPTPDVRTADTAGVVQRDWDAFISADVRRARDADVEIADRNLLLQRLQTLCTPAK